MTEKGPILLVEDEENDVFLMRRAFELTGVGLRVQAVRDGQEAMDYLRGHGEYTDRSRFPLPCLLITDVKMPLVDGFELLAWLKAQPQFDSLPRIAISSSCLECDLNRCLELGAQAYFIKPSSPARLRDLVRNWRRTYLARQEHAPG